jgi:hypothetical protein
MNWEYKRRASQRLLVFNKFKKNSIKNQKYMNKPHTNTQYDEKQSLLLLSSITKTKHKLLLFF